MKDQTQLALVQAIIQDALDEYEMEFAIVVLDDSTYAVGLAYKDGKDSVYMATPDTNMSQRVH